MLRIRIRDPLLFYPWIRDEHPDLILENLVSVFWVKNTFDADPGSWQPWFRDGKNQNRDPRSGINIPYPQHLAKTEGKKWGIYIPVQNINYPVIHFTVDVEGK